jgi:hypothetical protein
MLRDLPGKPPLTAFRGPFVDAAASRKVQFPGVPTGASLRSHGELYRYAGDDAWVREVAPKAINACDCLGISAVRLTSPLNARGRANGPKRKVRPGGLEPTTR